ncbi:unnamed protein product [Brassicogethes aeneus]|uniref:DNA helicase n=1 Tax=Brassicogethes aeneus TaxID=1431903 RepID=A0A9P0AUT6_BRAAE|nr:unnamed protein product [Brassicogethes aeneus]
MKKTHLAMHKSSATNGNYKISSFFTKKTDKPKNTEVISIDSDDDFVISNPVIEQSKSIKPSTSGSKHEIKSPNSRKRKLENRVLNSNKKKVNNDIITIEETDEKPSTCEFPVTPTKQILTVKTPEKLLTPSAYKAYLTPEKIPFLKSPATKKLCFNPDDFIVTLPKKEKTPNKKTPNKKNNQKNENSPNVGNIKKEAEKTPLKGKRTPKKLFEKTPEKLAEFNVEIMEKFVKITPSKSCKKESDVQFVKSSEKKQCSIKQFMSPKMSKTSEKAQNTNEHTPRKQTPGKSSNNESSAVKKAKYRLDFADTSKNDSCVTSETVKNVKEENFDEFWDEDFGFEISSQIDEIDTNTINLEESQHCKIVDIEKLHTKTILKLISTKTKETGKCSLQGFWIHTNLNVNDTVYVTAKKSVDNEWCVDNNFGLVVFEPDFLVSSTSVVNSVFCKRKSVLQERFHGFEPTNHFMIVGSIIHDLLQTALNQKARTHKEIQKLARELQNRNQTVRRLYECGMTISDLEKEIEKFVPRVLEFMETYVKSSNLAPNAKKSDQWPGVISNVADIEENIWCPELGLKGKVDVTIETGDKKVMPLELKTGRASCSLEHRGQVMLYVMMMNKLGYEVPAGLLLYLREGVLKEIPMSTQEQRDIMMLRNELAYYLNRNPVLTVDTNTKITNVTVPELPEPINHRACQNCAYNVICASFIRYNKEDVSSNKTLQNIQNEALNHISDDHLKYFMHWNSLLALESNCNSKMGKSLREIYTKTPTEREPNGRCIINLKISKVGQELNFICEHSFEKIDFNNSYNFLSAGINENAYVIVSTDKRPAVAAGFVHYIDAKSITVYLERDLSKKFPNSSFHIDTYDSNSIQTYNMASLTLLLELTERSEQLRKIIVDKVTPTFETKLPKVVATKGTPILKRLNRVQQRAVLKAIAARDYFLIKGMPGTGKTTTIVALVQLLVELGKSVIITSHTHSAVDNVCTRLIKWGVKFMRLGAESRINPNLKQYSEHYLTKNCNSPEELEQVYNSQLVLAVTCLGSGHPVLSKRTMDICIVDESTQVLQTSVIRPIYAAKTFILIGDPDQLPAVVKSLDAVKLGMTESIFDRLNSTEATIALNLNFRMNTPITTLANALTYKGELQIGNDSVANATLNLPHLESVKKDLHTEKWILNILKNDLDNSVIFLDTGPTWKMHKTTQSSENEQDNKCSNKHEASIVARLVDAFLKAGVPYTNIGVIAPFRAQVALLSATLEGSKIDVSTVDQFQGKDKNLIFFSCTKSREEKKKSDVEFEILEDKRRLNVAITRAKNKLILVGDVETLKQYSTFKKLLGSLEEQIVQLKDKENGFDWDSLLEIQNRT